MKIQPVRLYVHPAFKTKLKVEAAEKDMSIIELTKEKSMVSKELDLFNKKPLKNGKTYHFPI